GELPRRQVQCPHSLSPILLAHQAGFPRSVECSLTSERLATKRAAIESRKKAPEANVPKGKVAKRNRPVRRPFNFASRQEDQPEHRLRYFPFWQNQLGDFADHGHPSAEPVITLRLIKGLEQFALLNAHKIARFLLDVPKLHVRKDFQRGAVAVLDP